MTAFRIVSENELGLQKKGLGIDAIEIAELIDHKDTFIKLLSKIKYSYQIELSKGTYRGKEDQLYRSMETIDEIVTSLKDIDKLLKEKE